VNAIPSVNRIGLGGRGATSGATPRLA